jgi:hypothetical protein
MTFDDLLDFQERMFSVLRDAPLLPSAGNAP